MTSLHINTSNFTGHIPAPGINANAPGSTGAPMNVSSTSNNNNLSVGCDEAEEPYSASILAAYDIDDMYPHEHSPTMGGKEREHLLAGQSRASTSSYTESAPSRAQNQHQQFGTSPGFTSFPAPEHSTSSSSASRTPSPPSYTSTSSSPTTSPIRPDRFAPPKQLSTRLRALSQERPDPLRVWTSPAIYRQMREQQNRRQQASHYTQSQSLAVNVDPATTLSSIPSTACTNANNARQGREQELRYPRLHIDLRPALMSEKTPKSWGWDLEGAVEREVGGRWAGYRRRPGRRMGLGEKGWVGIALLVLVVWLLMVAGMVMGWGR